MVKVEGPYTTTGAMWWGRVNGQPVQGFSLTACQGAIDKLASAIERGQARRAKQAVGGGGA